MICIESTGAVQWQGHDAHHKMIQSITDEEEGDREEDTHHSHQSESTCLRGECLPILQ